MQMASTKFRTYAIDFWGFGDSAKNHKYSFNEQVSLINQFIDQLGMLKVAFVCHGLGALTALKYAQMNPEGVDRIMAVSFPFLWKSIDSRILQNQPVGLVDWLINRIPDFDAIRTDVLKNDPTAVNTNISSLAPEILTNLWQNQYANCLYVNGLNDPVISPPGNDTLNAIPENSHAIGFAQSGHFPMLDESSKFDRLLIDFLSLEYGESPRQLQLKEEWKRRVR
jgi:pimeloyl-ACP methyl ester carboxylesterase